MESPNARLRAELAALKAQEPVAELLRGQSAIGTWFDLNVFDQTVPNGTKLYAAPVSEAKAQGVVMPEPDIKTGHGYPAYSVAAVTELFASLNAAPVQRVVPDGSTKMQWPEIVALVNEVLGCEAHKYPCERGSIGHEMTGINFNSLARIIDRVLSAATAAPAADAGLVDMYRHLQKVTPYRFKKIQDASITDGGDVMYFHKDRFDAALLADMAAHCAAKGVV